MQKIYEKLYKIRNDGKIQVWWMEQYNQSIRTHSGILGQLETSLVSSSYKECFTTNENKKNQRTNVEQATFEIVSQYKDKLSTKYSYDVNENKELKLSPMLADKYKNIIFPVYSQKKYDGIRCIINKNICLSRSNKPIVSIPHIQKILRPYIENYTLDGEIYNHTLRKDFNKIISLARKTKPSPEDLEESSQILQYHVYDIIEPNKSYHERLKILTKIIKDINNSSIVLADTHYCENQEQLDELYSKYLEDEYEGQMIRDPNGLYENKRSKNLIKRKEFIDEEFSVISINEGEGNWKGYAKTVTCLKNNETFKATIKGDMKNASEILKNSTKYIGGVATVRYQNLTPDGIPRFPIVVALYPKQKDF